MIRHSFACAAAMAALAPALASQTLPALSTHEGTALGERHGACLADAGDLNGDAVADFWVGSPFDSTAGFQSGAVRAISGAGGGTLYTVFGSAAVDHFGWSIAALGDIDGDGIIDFAAGAPDSDFQTVNGGAVRVVSGANGVARFTLAGSVPGAAFGYCVCAAGHVNADGIGDLSVGSPFDQSAGIDAGAVDTWSGLNGAQLARHFGAAPGDRLGIAVANAGDVNSDGRSDLLAGADQEGSGAGYATVYSGLNGFPILSLPGASSGELFGCALAGGSDLDGDGTLDIAVGASDALHQSSTPGAVRVFSSAGGALLWSVFGAGNGEAFGSALALTPDLDGDGRADLAVAGAVEAGAIGAAGVVRCFSSRSQRILHVWRGRSGGDRFGLALCAASDRDGDGLADLLAGAPKDDSPLTDCGAAFVLSTRPAESVHYCSAKLNSQGCTPLILASGYASASDESTLELVVSQVVNNKPGLFLFGKARASTPFQGGILCLAPPLRRSSGVNSAGSPGPSNCSGVLRWIVDASWIQHLSWQPGEQIDAQAWYRDPQHPDGTASGLSSGVEFSVWL
ncbi:MAG TPA: hypothetical protein VK843_05795 [Planctomycetota bacterium]|nr:hypothetical protein [Planctomycetota bacterium]